MLKQMDKTDIESVVRQAVSGAVDFVESEIADDRIKAQRYYDGETDIGEEDGRSKVVATKVRDTIRAVKPSLMRIFLSTDKPVEFVPRNAEDAQLAEQMTEYVQYAFNRENGYRVINDVFHDALLKKVGIVKVSWQSEDKPEIYTLSNLNDDEFSAIVNEDNVNVISHTETTEIQVDEFGLEIEATKHDLKIIRVEEAGKLCIESVPPEEFFVTQGARNIDTAYGAFHRTEMTVAELMQMGFDYEEVADLGGLEHSDSFSDVEEFERVGYDVDANEEDTQDPSMRLVAVTEAYMKIDIDGTGIPILHKLLMGGSDYRLLSYEPVGFMPFAVFEVDPEPHTFYGRSIADLIVNDQDAATAMLRGLLDNIALTNNPRTEILEDAVNIDDMLNNEIGGLIRVRQIGATNPHVVPFTAGQTLPALQYFDMEIEGKTGVTKASSGLSPDALQSTTATAVAATVQAQAAQIEVMARNLAEGGMRQLFKLILRTVSENVEDEQVMRLSGSEYVPVDPRTWDLDMDLSVNVGLGTGQEEQKMAALSQTFQIQSQIMQSYGPSNGLVSLKQVRNTLSDMLAMSGLRNVNRYFAPVTPEMEQAIAQMAQQAQGQQGGGEAEAYLQAEMMKAQTKAQTDMAKLQAEQQHDLAKFQLELQKYAAEDDLKRDKMDQDLLVKAAEILAKHGTAVDIERIKQMQAAPRNAQVIG